MKIEILVPNGKSGNWSVETKTITKEDERKGRLRAMFSFTGRFVPAGTYKGLKRNGNLIMSNTPDEIGDHIEFIHKAKGNVLINGLGLGVALKAILEKTGEEKVKKVIVVENSKDVIKLVAPTYKDDKRITIVNEDAFKYVPPKGIKFDAVWHDIWDNICSDNLPEMAKLHRKYGRKTDWQGSWCKSECRRNR